MPARAIKSRPTPLQLLIHLFMTPQVSGTFSWQLAPDQMSKLSEDLRWLILRKVFPSIGGTIYRIFLQKRAIRIDSLDAAFFREVLDLVKAEHSRAFNLSTARKMDDLTCIKEYFLPIIIKWAKSERSTSVSRELTPSIEDLIFHQDSSGNIYQRFPDEFCWILKQTSPDNDADSQREIPREMLDFVHHIARELTDALRNLLDHGKFDKYIILLSRLEEDSCTWEMTHAYLKKLGVTKYSSWKSFSVVSNRIIREYCGCLPADVLDALHQNDSNLTAEEKHTILREAVSASLELYPLPSPKELIAAIA